MTDHERIERQAFVRWMRREHPGVSVRRYGPPARDQYLVPSVQEAWQGWFARSFRCTQSELTRAAKRGQKIAAAMSSAPPNDQLEPLPQAVRRSEAERTLNEVLGPNQTERERTCTHAQ